MVGHQCVSPPGMSTGSRGRKTDKVGAGWWRPGAKRSPAVKTFREDPG